MPHSGGLWERAVQSLKYHLRRTYGSSVLTIEEFITLLARLEAILNSRPLTELSSDPNDLEVLTPGHFLIGRPFTALPEPLLDLDRPSLLRRWQLVGALTQRIWARWSLEYLHSLQTREKWLNRTKNLRLGDLVLIHDPHAPPMAWKIGRIIKVYPGDDEQVRVADVKTPTGQLTRPALKLYPLPSITTTEK